MLPALVLHPRPVPFSSRLFPFSVVLHQFNPLLFCICQRDVRKFKEKNIRAGGENPAGIQPLGDRTAVILLFFLPAPSTLFVLPAVYMSTGAVIDVAAFFNFQISQNRKGTLCAAQALLLLYLTSRKILGSVFQMQNKPPPVMFLLCVTGGILQKCSNTPARETESDKPGKEIETLRTRADRMITSVPAKLFAHPSSHPCSDPPPTPSPPPSPPWRGGSDIKRRRRSVMSR